MDFSIRAAHSCTHAPTRRRCVDRGLALDDHGMNPWVPAVADWKTGWLARHHEVVVEGRQLQMSPP